MESKNVERTTDVEENQEVAAENKNNSPETSMPSTSRAANDEPEVPNNLLSEDEYSLASSSIRSFQIDDFSFKDTVELKEYLERDAVAAKYRPNLRSVNSYTCLQNQYCDDSSISTQSRSWSVFRQLFEEDSMEIDSYQKACELYHDLFEISDRTTERQFQEAEDLLSQLYPFYWEHLMQEYQTNFQSETYLKETSRKTMIINSCKRLLEEEDRYSSYRPENIGSMRRIRFDGRLTNLNKDFEKACYLMREEYPLLLIYLVQTLELMKFNTQKMRVEKRRQRITELAQQPVDKLKKLNEKYRNMKEPKTE